MNFVRVLVLCLGLAGTLIFTGAFIASWTTEHFISKTAREVIRYRVSQEMHEKVDAIGADFLLEKAKIFARDNAGAIDRVKLMLKAKLPEIIAGVISEMEDLSCRCRKWLPTTLREGLMSTLTDLTKTQDRLKDMIRAKYLETEAQLTREFRIFTGTNAMACILLVLATLFRPKARIHLLPPALVLLLATTVTSYFYLFNQNWLHTIVFGDYVGFAYVAYFLFVFACLGDILLNYARVTAIVFDATLGSVFRVLPC